MAIKANEVKKWGGKSPISLSKKKIGMHEDVGGVQTSIFDIPGLAPVQRADIWPLIYRTEKEYLYILDKYLEMGFDTGFDLETTIKDHKPTHLGIGFYDPSHQNMGEAASIPWDRALARQTFEKTLRARRRLVGHNVITSDRPWASQDLGIETALADWWDTLLTHYGANMHLTKMAGKAEDDDEGEQGQQALGMMDIWTATRTTALGVRNWKQCRGADCAAWGGPCPIHRRFDYNAVDSWAGSALQYHHKRVFAEHKVPDTFIEHLHDIAEIGFLMQVRGMKIDKEFVREFDKTWAASLEELKKDLPFNVGSGPQILKYFEEVNKSIKLSEDKYKLSDTQKSTIQKVLEQIGENTPGYKELKTVFDIKASGKGSKSWFDEKYFAPPPELSQELRQERGLFEKKPNYCYIHPRFNGTGTATLRLASANPNAQNIPSKGPLARLRKSIVPTREDFDIIKADAKQLEVRIAIYDFGDDPNKVISLDPFTELVAIGEGTFEKAAEIRNSDPNAAKKWVGRDVAKIVAHSATNFGGMESATREKLNSKRFQEMENKGSVRIFWDWQLGDQIFYSNGINLSRQIFGSSTDENRKLALDLLWDQYYKLIPQIPLWHRKVAQEVWDTGGVRGLSGSFLYLDNYSLKDNIAAACSVRTQGNGAYFMRLKMVEDWKRFSRLWLMMVHDEMVTENLKSMSDKEIYEQYRFLEEEHPLLKGLTIPFEIKRGNNWGDLRLLEL